MKKKNNKKAVGRRHKSYIPKKEYNPVQLAKKIEQNDQHIKEIQQVENAKYQALLNHINLVTNFAMHDIKNAIHNMDGILYNLESDKTNEKDIKALNECLTNMRQSLEEFKQLSLVQSKKQFTVSEFSASLRILHSSMLNQKKIQFQFLNEDCGELEVHQPFHALIQVLSNLIQNSSKAVKKCKTKRIDVVFYQQEKYLYIEVCDTGCGVEEKYEEQIFNMNFSLTGGSGIGLYHAKWALENLKGNIRLIDTSEEELYTTIFEIKIPIK